MNRQDWFVTGADASHFENSKMLVASCLDHAPGIPILYCDFGLTEQQRRQVLTWPVRLADEPAALRSHGHPWRAKGGIIHYLDAAVPEGWRNVIWVDADCVFLRAFPELEPLMDGYDLLDDVNRFSVGEIAVAENIEALGLRPDDAYFNSGFWITNSPEFLSIWDRLTARVQGMGILWENDSFVASIYEMKPRIRTVAGNIWHVRGSTSMDTVEEVDGQLCFRSFPCLLLHCNTGFDVRKDGRRVFRNPLFRNFQDHYEQRFLELSRHW